MSSTTLLADGTKKSSDLGQNSPSRASMELPEGLREGDDTGDDAVAHGTDGTIMMNQSIFSMIARAGSHADPTLHTLYEEGTSDSEISDTEGKDSKDRVTDVHGLHATEQFKKVEGRHRKSLSDNKLFRSLPRLHMRPGRNKREGEDVASSHIISTRPFEPSLEAVPASSEIKSTIGMVKEIHGDHSQLEHSMPVSPSNLALRLKHIFQFDEVEDVISAYTCWLVQNVLLQGFMYITQNHVCFFAHLPKKYKDVGKKGYLSKRGNSKYTRYWFTLTGNTLSYYNDPQDIYFPRNRINLQYGISASVVEPKDNNKESTQFTITTDKKTYHLRADSATSALDWVNAIQKVIFRMHNEGNNVKISLPLQNIIEVDQSPLPTFTETIKFRVIDNDETYAVDEYFFTFPSNGNDALNVLQIMVDGIDKPSLSEGVDVLKDLHDDEHIGPDSQGRRVAGTAIIKEHVRATLVPLRTTQSPRMSGDHNRVSFDSNRQSSDATKDFRRESQDEKYVYQKDQQERSFGVNQHPHLSDFSANPQDSTDSVPNSLDPGTESSAAIQSIDETDASASQILQRSDLFQGPTIHHSQLSMSDSSIDRFARRSQDTTRSLSKHGTHHAPQSAHPSNSPLPSPHQRDAINETIDPEQTKITPSASSSALQGLMQPIHRATGLAGIIRSRSKRMGSLLATETMGYYEKVSGMWAGGHKHYNVYDGLNAEDCVGDVEDDETARIDADRFRAHFALPESEQLQAVFFGSLQRLIPVYGKLYLSNRHLCFRSFLPTTRTKLVLPLKDIENVEKEKGFRMHYYGLVFVIKGHEELFFEFNRKDIRDDCAVSLHRSLESARYVADVDSITQDDLNDEEEAKAEDEMLREARRGDPSAPQFHSVIIDSNKTPLIFDDNSADFLELKPPEPLRVTCLTIGSRGDVQPYIALCKGLIKEGHKARIATHAEFEPWIRSHDIEFAPVAGNPAELMRICVEHGMFTYGFLKETTSKFRVWLDELLRSAYSACEGSDVLIESPSAMAGIHIAEALEIPYFRAFTMPWTRTRTYPHAFTVPEHKLGGAYNSVTYVAFETIFWQAISGQVNNWRKADLGLKSTNMRLLQSHLRPFMYNFSPFVVAPPIDWPDWISVTGYWFLDEATTWTPPPDLLAFIQKARLDGKKVVYVGFGSIVVDKPQEMTELVVEAIEKAGVRCILSKGWSDRWGKKDVSTETKSLPEFIFEIQSAPHDWLFKQIDAAVHHGGSGTTGASLRAGIPTVIRPFFGDQFFYGSRVEDLGVGVCIRKWTSKSVGRAIWEATHDERIKFKARVLGEQIRKENGVQTAIQTIYRELERAKSLIKKRGIDKHSPADVAEEIDESWTWIEGEDEYDVNLKLQKANLVAGMAHMPPPEQGGSSATVLSSMILQGTEEISNTSAAKGKGRAVV